MKIQSLHARQILDSRGNPTIEAEVTLDNSIIGRAAVPSGASTGTYEAVELRDQDPKLYLGKSLYNAINNIHNSIQPALIGLNVTEQRTIDELLCSLDGTPNKARLGANAMLAVSLACARAAALASNQKLYEYLGHNQGTHLPIPLMNVLNGGAHADNPLDFQEFMIVPHGAASFSEALRMGVEIFHTLKNILKGRGLNTNVGDEGGFAPALSNNRETLDLLLEAITKAGYTPGTHVSLALDVAANEFYQDETYKLSGEKLNLRSEDFIQYYENLCRNYPIVSLEDPLAEDDWHGWQNLTTSLGKKFQIVGDDLFVTNPERLQKGIETGCANAILIKLNQIGTLTETLDVIELAKNNDYACVISHRSGETGDNFIADLAVATNAGQIKTGSLARTDRVSKYNQLLRIEEYLAQKAVFVSPF